MPPPLPPAAAQLLHQARRAVAEAAGCVDPRQRYATAHLGALRGAAAVLAARTRPESGRRRPRSAWVLLGQVTPELAEWATFFAAGAAKRAAAEAGLSRAVTEREADDLVRDAGTFLAVVEHSLGVSPAPEPPGRAARPRVVVGPGNHVAQETTTEPRDPESRDAEPRDPEPRDPEPRDPEPRDPEPRDAEPRDAERRNAALRR